MLINFFQNSHIFRKSIIFFFRFFLLNILFIFSCSADWWHNNSFIMGGRPTGMGGAYTGIGTGSAGVFYNPGGMGFSPDLQLSVSTTTYYFSNIKQQGYLSDSDTSFELGDADLLNGYFGGIFRLSTETPLYLAFAIYNKDYVNIDNEVYSFNEAKKKATRFVQKLNSTENIYSLASAIRFTPEWSIGGSIGLFDLKYSEVQNANIFAGPFPDPDNIGSELFTYEVWNYTSSFFVRGIEAGLGFAFRPNEYISFGLSGKYKFILAQDAKSTFVDSQTLTKIDEENNFKPIGTSSYDYEQYANRTNKTDNTKPFGALPYMIRFGIGLFPIDFQTFSADIAYYSANEAKNPFYRTKDVFDYFIGSETKFFNTIALRLGHFTNNWSGDPSVKDQYININFIGYTAGLSYIHNNATYGVTYMHQQTKPGAQYQLEQALIDEGNKNPSVNWTTNQFSLIITGEM